ncbi:MAG TPA: hypothetical protein VFV85_07770 [Conexibacter sp.]|nr:hypothetical protein [Conexibacter sp.]
MSELFADIEREPRPRVGRDAPWLRRTILSLLAIGIVAVLAGAIGQVAGTSHAAAPAVRLTLSAPHTVRGGLLFGARVEIHARTRIARPTLVLGHGWLNGMQVNTIEPTASQEQSINHDQLALSYDPIDAGQTETVYMQFQVDPTNTGRRAADVSLLDGSTTLATIPHTLTVLP